MFDATTGNDSLGSDPLTKYDMSRLAWLCDARVATLRRLEEHDVKDPEIDEEILYFQNLAARLRELRAVVGC